MKTKHYHGHREVLNCIAVINWLMLVAACFIAPLVLQAAERNHLPVTTKSIGLDIMPVAHVDDFHDGRLYVRKGHTGSGASWDDALGELSDAIELSVQLNTTANPVIREIWVAGGIYKPTGLPSGYTMASPNVTARDRTFELPRGVMIYGGFVGNEVTLAARDLTVGTNASVLSGDLDNNNMLSAGDAHHVVTSRLGNAETGLDGFLIMGGNADVNSFFAYTRRTKGAGIYLYSSSAVLRNLHIELNRAWEGAGIYMEGQPVAGNPNPVFENLSIRNNSGLQGVGMFIDGCHPEITGGAISDNTTDGVDNPASLRLEGGGVRISNAAAPRFDDVNIHNNKSVWGGGVFLEGSFPMMTNSSIRGNQAAAGGGIHERGVSKGIYTNLLIAGNFADGGTGGSGIIGFGGGVFSHRSESVYTNVTIAGNRATGNVLDANGKGGIHSLSDVDDTGDAKAPTLRNSIIWENSSGINYELPAGKRIIMHHRCFVQEMLPTFGYSNSSETDPQFVAPVGFADAPTVAGNYRLQSSSLGLDHGIGTYYGATQTPDLSAIVTDLDGHPRFYNAGFVDLGAYEFQGEPNAPQTRLYVMQGATGTGSNWDDALSELAEALQLIHSGTLTTIEEIWVAKGVYRPAYRAGNGVVNRDKAFVLPPDVQLYGGFAGNEQQLAQRVLGTLNTSVLSGDLDNNGQHSDGDAYHVVIAAGDVGDAVLDGFTITGGTSEIGDSGVGWP